LSLELQQRSFEYVSFFDEQWKLLQQQAFAKMPFNEAFWVELQRKENSVTPGSYLSPAGQVPADLIEMFGVVGSETPSVPHPPSRDVPTSDCKTLTDVGLLSDIFAENAISCTSHHNPGSNAQAQASFTAFEKDGLKLTMGLVKEFAAATEMEITCSFSNCTDTDFVQLIFQAAVPKYITMEWKPASASTIPGNNLGVVSQVVKVKNSASSKQLMMKLKIQYVVGNRHVVEQAQITSFPIQ